jgi:hypothetical protein
MATFSNTKLTFVEKILPVPIPIEIRRKGYNRKGRI